MVNETTTTPFRDTIYALGSGSLPSGIAVIRVSGTRTRKVVESIAGSIPEPRHAVLRTLRFDDEPLDTSLVVFFPGPGSFTGEDVAEFHLHGGRAVVQAVLDAVGATEGCRLAEAGEFTRRAFLNGKLDLTGAEALSDLVSADTEAQRVFAMGGAAGAYRNLYIGWQQRITRARAFIEAELDFAEEEDVPGSVAGTIWQEMEDLAGEIGKHLEGEHAGEIIREGFSVVLIGAPNSGKSSLLNWLAKREVAIVTEEAGTTRDLIEVSLDIGGYRVNVTDTAGIRENSNRVETIGIQRALERVSAADLVLILTDLSDPVPVSKEIFTKNVLRVGTKSDLPRGEGSGSGNDIQVSVKDGSGLEELISRIGEKVEDAIPRGGLVPARARHTALLREAKQSLVKAIGNREEAIELRAEKLRSASDSLGRITGEIDVEDLLDVIFSEFCIGK